MRRSILIAAGIGVLAVMGLFAGRLFGRQMDADPGHGPRAARMFEHIASRLELTEAQKTSVRGVLKAHADEILAQVKAGMDARKALHDAVVAQPSDEAAIRSLAAQIGTVHGEGALLIVKIRSEIWPILTPIQQQKFLAFHDKMGKKGDEQLQSLASFLRGES
ncbi:MAG TPA: Spy/CpxP family protein refolding chaperone [Thermoanaerobaculia bacterium]|nr:Spy/CpxP family protein refolding chaperone [Thermoanaerobaculia bacterium]